MDPAPGNVWGMLILLSLWSGATCGIELCVEKISSSSNTCTVELMCSMLGNGHSYEWFRGAEKVTDDESHKVKHGSKMLQVSLASGTGETVYRCKNIATQEEMVFDVRRTCAFSEVVELNPGCSYWNYLNVKLSLTAVFLAVVLAIWFITIFLCRQKSSQDQKIGRASKAAGGAEEGIYAALKEPLDPGTHRVPKEQLADATGEWVQAEVGPTSSLREQTEAGPSSGLREQAEAGPSSGLREQAEAGPSTGLRGEYVPGPSSVETVPEQGVYTGLKREAKDEEYQSLKPQAPEGQAKVTYSAETQEVMVQISA